MRSLKNLRVDEIKPDPKNPREEFPEDELAKLAESIDHEGVLVPVVVYKFGRSHRLLDGERRWRCAAELGLNKIPAMIVDKPTEEDRLRQMFNIHMVREPWKDIPTAHALKKLMTETGVKSTSELSQITGLTTNRINRLLFFLDLRGKVRTSVENGEVPLSYFYEVYKEFAIPLEKQRPVLFSKFSKTKIFERFLAKRRTGAIKDTYSVRDAKYIIRKAAEDDPDNKKLGPLDETLETLLNDDELSVKEAYEDTVMVAVEADKLQKRADGMVAAFERLLEHAVDDGEADHVRQVGANLIEKLEAVIG